MMMMMSTATMMPETTTTPQSQALTYLPEQLAPLNIQQIMNQIPHRYPFLLLDAVTAHEQGAWIEGYKNVSINEPFFQGHFPNQPIMPGVLQLEALAQLGGVLMSFTPKGIGKLGVFAGLDNVRFRRMVLPGDRLDLRMELTKMRGPVCKMTGIASVDGQPAVEAELMFSFVDMVE
jgi:3-hydroxyacyl-[acyl-carrier-protein] dehydratase